MDSSTPVVAIGSQQPISWSDPVAPPPAPQGGLPRTQSTIGSKYRVDLITGLTLLIAVAEFPFLILQLPTSWFFPLCLQTELLEIVLVWVSDPHFNKII